MKQSIIFISYSHRDEAEKDELVAHLGVLKHSGLIETWSDDQIYAGSNWEGSILQAINNARVAIMLITANFLNSEFALKAEVPQLLHRRQQEGLVIVPVLARACAWRAVEWLRPLQVFPRSGTPIWSNGSGMVDENLSEIAEHILSIVDANSLPFLRSPHRVRGNSSTSVETQPARSDSSTVATKPSAPVLQSASRLWHVLAVDDEPSWQKRLSRILGEINCNVVTVNSFDDAINAINATNFDLITVDLNLDKSTRYADGLELMRRIRELLGPDLPIIVVTGTGGLEEQRRAFKEFNVIDFIQKAKLDFEEFQDAVLTAVSNARRSVKASSEANGE